MECILWNILLRKLSFMVNGIKIVNVSRLLALLNRTEIMKNVSILIITRFIKALHLKLINMKLIQAIIATNQIPGYL